MSVRRFIPCLVFGALLPASLSGCKRLSTGAREDFARRFSCPAERIDVKRRAELRAQDVVGVGQRPEVPPPNEVKKDPGRYAEWKKQEAIARQLQGAQYADYEVFEATGCGHTTVLACHHPRTPDQRGDYPTLVSCEAPPAPSAGQ